MNRASRLLYVYTQSDAALREELERHLSVMRRQRVIEGWHDQLLTPGDDARARLNQQLREADIVLLLLSADFIASDSCYETLQRALRRHDDRSALLIPVIVRPFDWRGSPIGGMEVLPADGRAVTLWPNRDEAWLDVAQGIRRLFDNMEPALVDNGPVTNPYRGLLSFQPEQERDFFGREELTRQLWQSLRRLHQQGDSARLLAVIGASGSGKSSVVRAGLIPALRRTLVTGSAPPRIVIFRPGPHPIESLARSLVDLETTGSHSLLANQIQELRRRSYRRTRRAPPSQGTTMRSVMWCSAKMDRVSRPPAWITPPGSGTSRLGACRPLLRATRTGFTPRASAETGRWS